MRRRPKTTIPRPDERRGVDDSAVGILARLERYTAWLRGRPWPADTLLPQPTQRRPRWAASIAPLMLAVLACILAVLAFEQLDNAVATLLSVALTLVGIIASYVEYHAQGLGPSAVSLPV